MSNTFVFIFSYSSNINFKIPLNYYLFYVQEPPHHYFVNLCHSKYTHFIIVF